MIKMIAIDCHRCEYPTPITFDKGTQLKIGECYEGIEEWNDWYLCSADGQQDGWVPLQVIELIGDNMAVAKESYTARELDVDVGDVLECLRTLNGWAWCVRCHDGKSGWVPLNCVEIYQD